MFYFYNLAIPKSVILRYPFESNTKFIINQTIETNKTILYASSEDDNLNSYDIRNSYGKIYIKDVITGDVSELSSKLEDAFYNKYIDIKEELYNNVLDFNIYNDFLWIKTNNYIIFEKLIYQDGKYLYSGIGENYIKYKEEYKFLTNISTPFIFEDRNYSLIVLLSGNNIDSKSYSIVPFIYKIDYNTCVVTLINFDNITQSLLDTFINKNLKNVGKLRKINKPILTYNSRNNKYVIVTAIEDQNEFVYLCQHNGPQQGKERGGRSGF